MLWYLSIPAFLSIWMNGFSIALNKISAPIVSSPSQTNEFASINFLAAKGDKRKTPFELDGLRARVESLSVVKNYIDNKFLERAVPGEKSAQVKFHSIHKDSKNYEQEYKPSLPKATEYVYEIRTSKAKDWKELLEEKGLLIEYVEILLHFKEIIYADACSDLRLRYYNQVKSLKSFLNKNQEVA